MSFYAFAIMALAFEKAQRYHEEKKKEKVSVEWLGVLKIQSVPDIWSTFVQAKID